MTGFLSRTHTLPLAVPNTNTDIMYSIRPPISRYIDRVSASYHEKPQSTLVRVCRKKVSGRSWGSRGILVRGLHHAENHFREVILVVIKVEAPLLSL